MANGSKPGTTMKEEWMLQCISLLMESSDKETNPCGAGQESPGHGRRCWEEGNCEGGEGAKKAKYGFRSRRLRAGK